MQTLRSESILVSQIFDTDRSSVRTCVGVALKWLICQKFEWVKSYEIVFVSEVTSLNYLRFQVLISEILYKSLSLSLLPIPRRVSVGEAAVMRNFIVVTGDRNPIVLKLSDNGCGESM